MGRFLLRRLVYLTLLVVIATSVTYLLAATALHPRSNFEGRNPPPPAAVVEQQLNELNMNDHTPLLQRYVRWIRGVPRGDFGLTIERGSVREEMGRRVGVSLRLLLIGSVLGALAGVSVGAYSAVRHYRLADRTSTVAAFVILSMPTVVLAVFVANGGSSFNNLIGFRLVYNTGEYLPGMQGWSGPALLDRLQHLILPSLVLVLQGFAFYSRYQRNAMLDVLGSDFLRTARAKGLRRSRALIRHALRTALIPMGTFFAYQFTLLFIGSIFVERIYSWHGMGEWFVDSIQKNDINSTAAIGMFVAFLVLLAGFFSDLVTAVLDPRVRRS